MNQHESRMHRDGPTTQTFEVPFDDQQIQEFLRRKHDMIRDNLPKSCALVIDQQGEILQVVRKDAPVEYGNRPTEMRGMVIDVRV